ncbi:hypothetical protein HYALB_00011263 [Hymenoscyphus albidus]|uniref:Uncharacterized protein n=1 Tax=Hymenoscyphus albidus TaxID=595503 RepID=A0A9N9LWU2_9HELO|nr:hypothetical protein HYALB_00011263 [Hymenoscyphus albidus]
MASRPQVFDIGKPTILFDSHPEKQEGYAYSYYSALKSSLYTAFTGDVPKHHNPGKLRIEWWTNDKKKGLRDYDLHEHELVRKAFYELDGMKEVERVVVLGYSGQNPYLIGEDEWEQGRKGKKGWKHETKGEEVFAKRKQAQIEQMNNSVEGRTGKLVDIDDVIQETDRLEEKKMREQREKMWKEAEGMQEQKMAEMV